MLRLFAIFVLCLFCMNFGGFSYEMATVYLGKLNVGKQPMSIYEGGENKGVLNVFCAGWDGNYNDTLDIGDEIPSWWRVEYLGAFSVDSLDSVFKVRKVRDFYFEFIGSSFRPAVDTDAGLMYYGNKDTVRVYDYETGETVNNFLIDCEPEDISIYDNMLFLSVYSWFTGESYVLVFDLNSNQVVDTIYTYPFPMQSIVMPDGKLLVLCSGFMGSNDSKLQVFEKVDGKYQLYKEIWLGDTGNHLLKVNDYTLVVTMNFSHELKIVDLNDLEVVGTVKIPTSLYNGPRESCIGRGNLIYTSTYSDKVYISDIYDSAGVPLDSILAYGKSEGMCYFSGAEGIDFLLIANPFPVGEYTPDSTINIYGTAEISSVDEKFKNYTKIYPNPASDFVIIELGEREYNLFGNEVKFQIFDLSGKEVFSGCFEDVQAMRLDLNECKLVAGNYFIRLIGKENIILPFRKI